MGRSLWQNEEHDFIYVFCEKLLLEGIKNFCKSNFVIVLSNSDLWNCYEIDYFMMLLYWIFQTDLLLVVEIKLFLI